jgi:tRNA(adenine34) deaminase
MDYEFYMRKALLAAEKALAAGEFPVGCVLVYDDNVLVTGARSGTSGNGKNEVDHAEMTALRQLSKFEDPFDHSKITVFTTMEPCLMCFSAMILNGISTVVYAYEDEMGGGANSDRKGMRPLYKNSRITVVPNILRHESLQLFQSFFSNPQNRYWKDSLLAQYTLSQ